MKIAFVSYEYLPDTAFGGIATYVWHAARMLARGGHYVEVVCGSPHRGGSETVDGVVVNRVRTGERGAEYFGPVASPVLAERHRAINGFDLVESPDANAEGAEFAAGHPQVALVIKLHTPLYLVRRLTEVRFGLIEKARFAAGALCRGRWPAWPPPPDALPLEYERILAHNSDRIAAPCTDIARIVGGDWGLPAERIDIHPLPFESPEDLDRVPVPGTNPGTRILFVGRLEPRKGVQHLGKVLRLVHRCHPDATLRCIGRVGHSPVVGRRMDAYLQRQAGPSGRAIEFPGPQPRERLATEFAAADVCVFPSLWENFPYVCQEAMTAARPIIGSSAGGMAEMLAGGAGLTLPPASPQRWADAICELLADGPARQKLGTAARLRVKSEYSYNRILPVQIASYEAAVRARRERGPRPLNAIPPRPPVRP